MNQSESQTRSAAREATQQESAGEVVIAVRNLSKRYEIYETPRDRLKQMIFPCIYRALTRVFGSAGRARGGIAPRYFREFWALHDVSFDVRKGETLGIVGRNGSGKSTLLQVICSTLAPTSGEIVVNGRISALLELGSGFNPEYTGRENVFLNGQILGLSQSEVEARLDEIVEFADIGDFIDQPVKTYSSGMAVRLAFAVAINVDPEILVIDEALAVGDVGFQARCFAKIGELQQRGVTLLFVSHSPGAVTQLCSRAILLDGGELLFNGNPYQTISAYNRLANAGTASFQDVRQEVVAMAMAQASSAPGRFSGTPPQEEDPETVASQETSIAAHFDQELGNSIKSFPFELRGCEISAVSVTANSPTAVNVLPMHRRYKLRFDVRFDKPVDRVRVAWVIKTMNGLIVGGGSTHQPGSGFDVPTPATINVVSEFVNIFAPGDYLIDVGVRGKLQKDDEFLHGISNAMGIRSVRYDADYRHGVVDCLVDPCFTLRLLDANGPPRVMNLAAPNVPAKAMPRVQ